MLQKNLSRSKITLRTETWSKLTKILAKMQIIPIRWKETKSQRENHKNIMQEVKNLILRKVGNQVVGKSNSHLMFVQREEEVDTWKTVHWTLINKLKNKCKLLDHYWLELIEDQFSRMVKSLNWKRKKKRDKVKRALNHSVQNCRHLNILIELEIYL